MTYLCAQCYRRMTQTHPDTQCPSCVAVPTSVRHPVKLKIQQHALWDMTYTWPRSTPILQDYNVRRLFFAFFYLTLPTLMLCVLTNGMWLGDTHWHPVTSATLPPHPLPLPLQVRVLLDSWLTLLDPPAPMTYEPVWAGWDHGDTMETLLDCQPRQEETWLMKESDQKKKLCRLSCRGSLVWFTGRWKVKLLLFNGTE